MMSSWPLYYEVTELISVHLSSEILQPFNGLFFQDNLGKPVPER